MKVILGILAGLILISCQQEKKPPLHPPGYNLAHPKVYRMPVSLLEISGQDFYKNQTDTIYVEQDEAGSVYQLVLGTDYIRKSTFKNHGDFEDIALCGNTVVMLRSNGKLYTFPFQQLRHAHIKNHNTYKHLLPKGEYESLYANKQTHRLYVLCKDCKSDKNTDTVSGYILQLTKDKKLKRIGQFSIDAREIAKKIDHERVKFKPSALAFNRRTKKWYILSSVNNLLVLADEHWKIDAVYPLDNTIYLQPEGLAFDEQGNLYISSEGSKLQYARIFKIKYRKH